MTDDAGSIVQKQYLIVEKNYNCIIIIQVFAALMDLSMLQIATFYKFKFKI